MSNNLANLPSELLAVLWHNRLFDTSNLRLADNRRFKLIDPGHPIEKVSGNDVAPDFLNASIYFIDNNITLHGHIKIDSKSSDFRNSGLITHPSLTNIILHIVAHQDITLYQNNQPVPTFIIQPSLSTSDLFWKLKQSGIKEVICPSFISNLPAIHRQSYLSRLTSERLERKRNDIIALLDSVSGDWHECCYIHIIKSFGFMGQKAALEKLARSIPYKYIKRMNLGSKHIEAYLLGVGGHLRVEKPDVYTRELQDIYEEFRAEYKINPWPLSWKSGTNMRPQSMGITQLVRIASLLANQDSLLETILGSKNIDELSAIFDFRVDNYWHEHSYPSVKSSFTLPYGMTTDKINLLIINGVAPLLYTYGYANKNHDLQDFAIEILQQTLAENNSYTKLWKSKGLEIESGFDSQAIIQLHSEYCRLNRCESCQLAAMQLHENYIEGTI